MGKMLSFLPLKTAKRKWRQPWSTESSKQRDSMIRTDAEKFFTRDQSDYEDIDSSASSSRTTSNSYDNLLDSDAYRTLSQRQRLNAYLDHASQRRRCNLYFTIVLSSLLIVLVLGLTHAHYSSARAVESYEPPPRKHPWEEFSFLKRYHGGIRNLVDRKENKPEYPGDADEVLEAIHNISATEHGESRNRDDRDSTYAIPTLKPFNPFQAGYEEQTNLQECYLNESRKTQVPRLHAYGGVVSGFPENIIGSYDVLGLRNDVCFDRFGRLGPYGLGYSRRKGGTGACMEGDTAGAASVWETNPEVDFDAVRWHEIMDLCLKKNSHRFKAVSPEQESSKTGTQESSTLLPRSIVVIRTWHDYEYDSEDIMYLRALISELSVASGMEYTIHFLVHVRDDNLQIWSDERIYEQVLEKALPDEFSGMGTLWSEEQMAVIYGGIDRTIYRDIPVHSNYRSTFMALQYFAHKNPEYEYYWNWEMDTRYTGHFYHLFDRSSAWAKEQPRKGLWERNARFYVPSEHGSWEDFKQMVRVQTDHSTNSNIDIWRPLENNGIDPARTKTYAEKPIWGAEPPTTDDIDLTYAPTPPTSYHKDKYEWGVGEEADLITFNPLFDPEGTDWLLSGDVTGYNTSDGLPPRRAAIITNTRLSKRLLNTMHFETSQKKHTMFSEMWPGSCALHHGLKAVYVPHPEFIDRRWPTDYLAAIFNGGRNGASGGARTSIFSDDRQHNFLGMSYYYHAGAPVNLWRRWLGYKVNNDGGEEWELANEGRMCLPAILLHPVKQVDLVIQ